MATKKKATKKLTLSAEELLAKDHDSINRELAEIQTAIRMYLGGVGEALSGKVEELGAVVQCVRDKQAELEELYGKEVIAASLEELEIREKDAKRAHERALKIMKDDFADEQAELQRDRITKAREEALLRTDEVRAREIALEDEDRVRKLSFEARTRDQDLREKDLIEREKQLSSFEDRVKAEVAKQTSSIKREVEFKSVSVITELKAENQILQGKYKSSEEAKTALLQRLGNLEKSLEAAQAQVSAIATSALDKESGKAALDELRSVAHKQAESRK